MKLDYNRLNELLNSFGLSLKVENGNAIFVDIETNTPMKSYVVYKEGFADQKEEYTADAKTLLNGWPFYVDTENKHFRLNISVRDEGIKVYEITKNERKEPHLYERSELKADTRTFSLEESTFRRHTREDGSEYLSCDFISDVSFGVSEITDSREGGIKVIADNKRGGIWFYRDRESGEIVQEFESTGVEEISQEETTQLIEQARILKDTMRTLCPVLTENYSNARTNSVGPKK